MSFVERQINLQFSNGKSTLSLDGLRCTAMVTNPGGYNAFGQLQMRVYGMTLDDMNQYSSVGSNMAAVNNFSVTVSAGNVGGAIPQVFSGTLIRSFIDLSGAPDVAFVCSAVAGYYNKATAAAPGHWPGAQNAEDIIAGLVSQLPGFSFAKNNAHAVLTDHYEYGSIINQIQGVARAAVIPIAIENNAVTIWPNNGTRDSTVIDIGPDNGLVGYPAYWEVGFNIKCEFNPNIINGRQINLISSLPKANGLWPIQTVTHELSTLTPDGAWFSNVKMSPSNYVPAN
jgi:hypothetical protein